MQSLECGLQMNDYLYLYYYTEQSKDLLFLIFTSLLTSSFLESFYIITYIMLTWSILESFYKGLHPSPLFLIDPECSGFPRNLLAGRDILPT